MTFLLGRFLQRIFIVFYLIIFRDRIGNVGQYEAVAVIEFSGTVGTGGESQGHYTCDIKDKASQLWFKTNDNRSPIQVQTNDVSKLPYVVLYRRLSFK